MQELEVLARAYQKKEEYQQYCAGLTPALLYNIHRNKGERAMAPLDFFRKSSSSTTMKIRDSETLKAVFLPLFQKTK